MVVIFAGTLRTGSRLRCALSRHFESLWEDQLEHFARVASVFGVIAYPRKARVVGARSSQPILAAQLTAAAAVIVRRPAMRVCALHACA